jgi:MFS transporter, DHA1 family, tetracycline resistance protein
MPNKCGTLPAMATRRPRAPLPHGFGAVWSCVALDLVGFGIVLPILPLYAERFGASPATVGLLVASFSIAQLVFSPIWGRVSDRVGRKPVLVLSLAGTAVGSLLMGVADSLWLLFLGRILDGISGASVSVAQAAVADLAPPEQRPRLLGLLGAAFGLGFVAGPAIGALAALRGPELPFLIAAGIASVNALVASRRLPDLRPAPVADPDHAAAPPLRAIADLVTMAFCSLVAFSAFEATFALFGEDRLGLDEASTGAVFVGVGVLLVVVQSALVHPVVTRLGEGGALRAGLTANAAGLALLAAVDGWPLLVPALGLLTVGQGLVTPALASAVAGRVDPSRRGLTLGYQQAAGGLARVVGPVLGGLAFQHIGVPAPYVGGAVLLAVCALVAGGLRTPERVVTLE